ncbi:carboxy-S-adenosyl-L-methionine synthase CmoA [Gynuella sp.]|uniref:carboxy-S-adenosyl-L-methionine synthase CmoA n=1 Tax=Gynuella sp. TaxID=2969146 RepID=UPI003D099DA6
MERDQLFSQEFSSIEDFQFNERVARVFPDMIKRSIPGYSTLVSNIGAISDYYAQSDSNIYDLGCSLGAVSLSIQHRLSQTGCQIIAVDSSADMLQRARDFIETEDYPTPIQLTHENLEDTRIENASVVVMNFTLQFISPDRRLAILKNIYHGLKPGGVLILSEKIALEADTEWLNELHLNFKKVQGYSELEISQKRKALENVMITDSLVTHQERLRQAGFRRSEKWFQCFNFISIIAQK